MDKFEEINVTRLSDSYIFAVRVRILTIGVLHDYEYLCSFGFATILEFSMRRSR